MSGQNEVPTMGAWAGSRTFRLADTRGGSRLPQHHPPKTPTALVPRADLLRVIAGLLAMIADDEPGDPDAAAVAAQHDPGRAESDHVPALLRVAPGLHERRTGRFPAKAALVPERANLAGQAAGPAPPPGEPPRPGALLTQSETRVLRYLPTHMSAPEIAAELYLSPNTVKTHLRHVYQKLGTHSRHEAVQRAWAIGLFTPSFRRPATTASRTARHGVSNGTGADIR